MSFYLKAAVTQKNRALCRVHQRLLTGKAPTGLLREPQVTERVLVAAPH